MSESKQCKMLKSQSAIEFIVLATFMMLVIVSFFAVTSSKVLESKEDANKKIAEDVANIAYREVDIARFVNDGYRRIFTMPNNVNGINYTITITDNRELEVNYLGHSYIRFLPATVTGKLSIGSNILSKDKGLIHINSTLV